MEVKFTTNPKCLQNQNEDPNVVFAKIESPQNPFKTDIEDLFCTNFCNQHQKPTGPGRRIEKPCPVHNQAGDMGGKPFQCTHDSNCQGIMICTDSKGQSYLCTVHVQPKKAV
ncbi:hypothetical protein GE061_003764 [Apolygus lucorum]|uniref:Uncharacterized protein n=1 Tax=Apolygus lucorum TaxID=248454 RepID=A0A6A4JK00_APOLU|nr:hypothetical protein GE061_003764 [Apolygus lucorum]